MIIDIKSRGFSLTPALKSFVDQRMSFVLARYGEKISRVNVTLLDVNGPKGGVDKRCSVHLKLQSATSIVLQETHEDLYEAIVYCGNRLRRIVGRKVAQLRHRRRGVKANGKSGVVPEGMEIKENIEG